MEPINESWTCLVVTSDEDVICFIAASYGDDAVQVEEDPVTYRLFGRIVPHEGIVSWLGRDVSVSNREKKTYHQVLSQLMMYDATKFVFCHERSRFAEAPNWKRAQASMTATLGGFRR